MKKWKTLSKTKVNQSVVFGHYRVTRQSPIDSQKQFDFDCLELSDCAIIIAVDKDGNFVCVEHYRHGRDKVSLEFPAGLIHDDEDHLVAAKRELSEETGYTSENWRYLGEIDVNPAFMSNVYHVFYARDCSKVSQQNLDPLEEIDIKLVTKDELDKKIQNLEFNHSAMLSSLKLLDVLS